MKGYDYSQNGWYFITICSYRRLKIFGEIRGDDFLLNKCGNIVEEEILVTSKMRPNVKIDCFQIMPNHVHFILVINNNIGGEKEIDCKNVGAYCNCKNVGAYCNTPLQKRINKLMSPKNNLGSIIRGFKSASAKRIQLISDFYLPIWQRNYFERIIRGKGEYWKLRRYIKSNPKMWFRDRNNR